MATDFSSRPPPPLLKRFAHLDLDDDDGNPLNLRPTPQKRPAPVATQTTSNRAPTTSPAPTSFERDLAEARALADDLTDTSRTARAAATPQARRTERAAELRRQRAPDPLPPPRPPRGRPFDPDELNHLLRSGRPPGVITMEIDLSTRSRPNTTRRAAPPRPASSPSAAPPRPASSPPTAPGPLHPSSQRPSASPPRSQAPVELTPFAARQIMLLAWAAGQPGSALRILSTASPGLGHPELDFALETHVEPDDLVFASHGVTILVDPQSFQWVSGRRITWNEVPGAEGFALASR